MRAVVVARSRLVEGVVDEYAAAYPAAGTQAAKDVLALVVTVHVEERLDARAGRDDLGRDLCTVTDMLLDRQPSDERAEVSTRVLDVVWVCEVDRVDLAACAEPCRQLVPDPRADPDMRADVD